MAWPLSVGCGAFRRRSLFLPHLVQRLGSAVEHGALFRLALLHRRKGSATRTCLALPNTRANTRSEEHTSEIQSLMRISYAVFCLKKKNTTYKHLHHTSTHVQKPHTTNTIIKNK